MTLLRRAILLAPLALAASCSVVNAPADPEDPEDDPPGDCGPLTTLDNCGACGAACAPENVVGASCETGMCSFSACSAGYLDCDGDASNGCEVDGRSDAAHCGTCDNSCSGSAPNASAACMGGECTLACHTGWDDCSGGTADGCETDVSSDDANCGGCGIMCPAGQNGTVACQSSACVVTACDAGFDDCDKMAANGCEADLSDPGTCGNCNTTCAPGEGCTQGQCLAGVMAFGEFRPALKCADFVMNGPSYQRYCFTLKGNWYCTGQHGSGIATCTDTPTGIRFVYDYPATWPMRFTPNTQDCMNYNPAFIENFAHAIGYANYTILQTKTGNGCTRTWLDANGDFQQTAGDFAEAQIYEIEYFN